MFLFNLLMDHNSLLVLNGNYQCGLASNLMPSLQKAKRFNCICIYKTPCVSRVEVLRI